MTDRGTILITAPYFMPVVERFRPRLEAAGFQLLVKDVEERAEEAELLEVIDQVDGVICGDDRFTPKVLAEAKRLKVISKWGTGIDSIDKDECTRLGIEVCRTPNAFTVPVADTVLGYALNWVRNLTAMDRAMKAGIWKKIPGRALSECTVGIIGVGDIGGRVARLFSAFGTTVLGTDIREIDPAVVEAGNVSMVELDTLLGNSDIVSVNCDLNATSEHLINESTLAKMRPGAFLINAARGPIVREPHLVAALQSGHLGGAALDVFEDEPLPQGSPLLSMDQVFIAPHNSNSSPTAWEAVHESTVSNLLRVLEARA